MWRPTNVDRPTGVFIGLIIVSLVLITVDLRASGAGVGGTLREGVQAVFTPVQRVVSAGTRPVADFLEDLSDIFSLRGENRRLRDEVIELQRQLKEAEGLETRVAELEAILSIEPPKELDSIVAQVLAVGVSEFDHSRVIDRGRSSGITVDMPVIDEGGLIGRIVSVTDEVARVRLISDPSVRVAVRIERTGETGVLTGRGSAAMVLEMFNTDAAVVEGDTLITADGRFPAGIPAARVLEPARSEVGFSLRTTAEPIADLTRIDYVRVLVFTRDQAGIQDLEDLERPPIIIPSDEAPAEGESDEGLPTDTTVPSGEGEGTGQTDPGTGADAGTGEGGGG
jgi:rod shape-determining protein MreC